MTGKSPLNPTPRQRNHCLLPTELSHCASQLDLLRHLGLDVFSRNPCCDQQRRWFGGLAKEIWDGVEMNEEAHVWCWGMNHDTPPRCVRMPLTPAVMNL